MRNCGKWGHFRVVCRSLAKVAGLETTHDTSENAFLGAIRGDNDGDNPWVVALTLEGKPVTLYIDTGAEVTVISEKTWRGIGRPELTPSDRTLRGPDSHVIPTLGKFIGTFTRGTRLAEGEVYVTKRLTKSLLGRPTIQDLDLVKLVAVVGQHHLSPKDQFPSLFQGLGKLEGEYTIELQDNAQPFALTTPRRVAIPLLNTSRNARDNTVRLFNAETRPPPR